MYGYFRSSSDVQLDQFGIFSILFQLWFIHFCFFFRLDELRHHLIPLYTYNPAEEQEDWGDYDRDDEEEELAVRNIFSHSFSFMDCCPIKNILTLEWGFYLHLSLGY